ncbi:MAG: 2-amino-4-hydroxy-6-hydroxymethyldihydropteridine diphosphokinase [Candidatus Margulisbacteria bacterium]|nr:2-amino-4-hydroxy-6-hydroxymethyldihydropteridine diphosphokinase [Candidatus Margulisiibacteriota bacterium]
MSVYLGLGSNLGERKNNILKAIELLAKKPKIEIIQKASLIETQPEGNINQNDFINTVLEIETSFSAQELLQFILKVEKEMGRTRQEKWGPRIIDIDIIFYHDQVINEKDLIIPHPHLAQRYFILKSLVELCPNFKHPLLKKTMLKLFNNLKKV